MTWTLCTSGSAINKAGTHANSTITASGSALASWCDMAEGRIETETRRTWIDDYSSLLSGVQNILDDVCSSLIAINIIAYDPTGYISREADILLNVNDAIAKDGLKILKDFKSNTLKSVD